MRAAVEAGYRILKGISERFGGSTKPLPRNIQGVANACIVGAIWLDGFGGRKYEWEVMSLDHVLAQLSADLDYLLCPEHKTSRIYGTLAKWMSPGLLQAVRCYLTLPRPDGVKTFLVPAGRETERVNVPSAFRTFAAHLLPKDKSTPTVNIMRKYYHRALMKLSGSEDKLKEVMTVLDGHSKAVIDRHYALRDAEDDVRLAKMLVKVVLGETAAWPDGQVTSDANQLEDVWSTFAGELEDQTGADLDVDGGDGDNDDEDLDWFPFAEYFGIRKPLHAICDLQCGAAAAEQEPLPIADVPAGVPYAELFGEGSKVDKGKADKKDNKDEKDKKDKKAKKEKKHKKRKNGSEASTVKEEVASPERVSLACPGRRSRIDPADKEWMEEQHAKADKGTSKIATVEWFKETVQRGIREKRLGQFVTPEGMRSHIRQRVRNNID